MNNFFIYLILYNKKKNKILIKIINKIFHKIFQIEEDLEGIVFSQC